MPTEQENRDLAQKMWDEAVAGDKPASAPAAPAAARTAEEVAAEVAAAPAAAATEVATDPDADRYAGIDQRVVDEIAGLKVMFAQTQTQLREAHGKIGGLNGELKRLKTAAPTTSGNPTAAQISAAAGDSTAMAKLKTDYPEFGAVFDAALEEKLKPVREQFARVAAAPADASNQTYVTPAQLEAATAALAVETVHPGWRDKVRTPEFAGWLHRQPPEIKKLAASESPRDSIELLNLHAGVGKAEVQQDRTTQRLNAAAAIPTGRSGAVLREKPLNKMTDAEFWQHITRPVAATA